MYQLLDSEWFWGVSKSLIKNYRFKYLVQPYRFVTLSQLILNLLEYIYFDIYILIICMNDIFSLGRIHLFWQPLANLEACGFNQVFINYLKHFRHENKYTEN